MITVVGRDAAGAAQRLSYSDFHAAAHAAFNAHKTWTELHIQHTRSGVLYCIKRSDESEYSILRVCSSCIQNPEEFTVAADKARKTYLKNLPRKDDRVRAQIDPVVKKPSMDKDEAKAAGVVIEAEQRRADNAEAQKRAAEYTGPKLTFMDARRFALVGVPELSVDYSMEEQDQIQKVNESLPLVEQCTKSKYVLVSNGAMILKLKPEQIDEKAWRILETDPKRNPHFGYSNDARRAMRLLGSEWVQVACPLLGAAVDVELKPAGFGTKMPSVQLFTYVRKGDSQVGSADRRFFVQVQMVELVRRFYPKALTKAPPLGRAPNSVFPEPFGGRGKNEPMILPLAFISTKTEQVLALVQPTSEWY